ncbi:hypothetical protein [Aquimarina aggregata]|uniref:hypothetical protein n=1 Tax=Aquimarina aggregata TaxID=1642818 RepID=UPI002491A638|nr:hypothetical protein [Aquimarina aggregata]
MKNQLKKKLNFEKLTIAKLNNIDKIIGGGDESDTLQTNSGKSTDPYDPRCKSKRACVIGVIDIA